MRRKKLAKGIGCLIAGTAVLVSNPVLIQAEDSLEIQVPNSNLIFSNGNDWVDENGRQIKIPNSDWTYDQWYKKSQRETMSVVLNVGDTLTPEKLFGKNSSKYDFKYGIPEDAYTTPGIHEETIFAMGPRIDDDDVYEETEKESKDPYMFWVTVIVKSGNSEFQYDEYNENYKGRVSGTATGKIVIDGVEHYIDSGFFKCDNGNNGTFYGSVCLYEDFFNDMFGKAVGRDENRDVCYLYNNKIYKVAEKKVTLDGESKIVGETSIFPEGYDIVGCDAYYCGSHRFFNGEEVHGCKVEFTFVMEEVSTTTTVPITVSSDAWNWHDYGTLKSLNLKVNDTVYPLSKTGTNDITLHNGDKVTVLAGESYELWSGTAKVLGTNVELKKERSEAANSAYYLYYDYETKLLSVYKDEDDYSGGWDNYANWWSRGSYKYDLKAQTNSGKPISGIAIVDDTLDGAEEFFGYKAGKTYTWGNNNTFKCESWVEDTPLGVITCRTNEDGIADMLMPISSDNSWKDEFGENFYPSCNVGASVTETDAGLYHGYVYANNGAVDLNKATLSSLGVSTSLKPVNTGGILGDSYYLVTSSFTGDKVMLKDARGKQIATVEMGIDSMNSLTKVKDNTFIAGDDIINNRDFSDIVPKVNIMMATGRDDWKVAVNYEKETSTFHIVATKNGEEETIPAAKKVQLSKTSVTYNGKAQTPTVKVVDSEGAIILSDNYTVSYKNNKNVGQATVTVTMKGNYTGTLTANFTIKPQSTKISSVTAKKKGFALKWNKQTSQTDGYQIQYAANKKFTSAKTVLVNKNKTVTKTVSKLNAKKTYYARVRTYKTVKINGKNTKIYSGWSTAKKVVTK